jgi:hypothetical protein
MDEELAVRLRDAEEHEENVKRKALIKLTKAYVYAVKYFGVLHYSKEEIQKIAEFVYLSLFSMHKHTAVDFFNTLADECARSAFLCAIQEFQESTSSDP